LNFGLVILTWSRGVLKKNNSKKFKNISYIPAALATRGVTTEGRKDIIQKACFLFYICHISTIIIIMKEYTISILYSTNKTWLPRRILG
jgi:hypothetical protein